MLAGRDRTDLKEETTMPTKSRNERPAPELRNGRLVERILKLRTKPMAGTQVAEKLGFAKNRLTTMLARIRWMARVELGGECPIGKVDQEVAKEFLQVWDMAEAARAKPASQWTPMTKTEGRAVSNVIGKVREAAAQGAG